MQWCGTCNYWIQLVLGDVGYDPAVMRGKCVICPPRPTGEYKNDLSAWPIVLFTDFCNLCRCVGCATPLVDNTDFLLQENSDYIFQETGDKIILE